MSLQGVGMGYAGEMIVVEVKYLGKWSMCLVLQLVLVQCNVLSQMMLFSNTFKF